MRFGGSCQHERTTDGQILFWPADEANGCRQVGSDQVQRLGSRRLSNERVRRA
jgi:hypothetical protein